MPVLPAALSPHQFGSETEAYMLFERVMNWRGILLPRWRRQVRLAGSENLEDGISRGRGVILWVQPCVGSTLAVKQALYDAGFPLAHLSRPAHGFSPHPFGQRYLNPILRRAESRFLAERIVIDDAQTIGPLRRLRALLKENRVVSITVTATASRVDEFEFLGGTLRLPRGPLDLAQATGAVLLPVFTHGARRVPVVEVFPSVAPKSPGPEGVQAAQQTLVEWLGVQVEEHPLDWIGWRADIFTAGPRAQRRFSLTSDKASYRNVPSPGTSDSTMSVWSLASPRQSALTAELAS